MAGAADVTDAKRDGRDDEPASGPREARLRALGSALPDIVFVLDEDGRYREILTSHDHLLYRSSAFLLGKTIPEVFPPAEGSLFMGVIARTLAEGTTQTLEYALALPQGRVWFEGRVAPLRDASSEKRAVVFLARDVTERKAAEQALGRSYSLLSAALDSTADGLLVVDTEGVITSFNERFLELWRIPKELAESRDDRRLLEFVLAQLVDPEAFVARVRSLYETPDATAWDELAFKDGRVFERYSRPQRLGSQIVGRVWSFRDVTARTRAQREAEAEAEKNRALLRNASDAIHILDPDGRLLEASDSFFEMLGYSREELLGAHVSRWDPALPEAALTAKLQAVLAQPHRVLFERKHRRRDGGTLDVEVSSSPIELGGRKVLFNASRDVTERRQLERERLRAQRLESIGTLAGGIAHDLNNMLQAVLGQISLAKLAMADPAELSAALDQAELAARSTAKLSNQLLVFAKGGQPASRPVDLLPVVADAARFALSGSRSSFTVAAERASAWARADDGQIAQVVQNVVLNAAQAMPDGGRVAIDVATISLPAPHAPRELPAGEYVLIAIADHGVGIDGAIIDRIFDPYFTTKPSGNGLGLATAYSIVRHHGGAIAVDSEPGRRTTFRIYLPAVPPPVEPTPARGAGASGVNRAGRVLVMDDDATILRLAKRLIVALGHEVEVAPEGATAVSTYAAAHRAGRPFDVVILDLTVRAGMGGEEALRRLLEVDPAVRAVVSSGYDDGGVGATFGVTGFVAALKKPYGLAELRDCLDRMLDEARRSEGPARVP